jgi:hypothetical protein
MPSQTITEPSRRLRWHGFRRFAVLLPILASALVLFSLPALAGQRAAAFQALLLQQVDSDAAAAGSIAPTPGDAPGAKLAHALLERLAADKLYLADLQHWLDTNFAQTVEDLLHEWYLHVEHIELQSVEYLDGPSLRFLWLANQTHAIADMPRENCKSFTSAQINQAMTAARQKLFAAQRDEVAAALAKAYARVLGTSTDTYFIQAIDAHVSDTLDLFHKLAKTLPPQDGTRLEQMYSYQGNKDISGAEYCERSWVSSRAIADWDSADGAALRRSMLVSIIRTDFDAPMRPQGMTRPATSGFVPGQESIHYPILATKRNVQGTTSAEIAIDAAGQATGVTITESTLTPASVTSLDGTVFTTKDLFRAMFERYYRAGHFPPKLVDGKPVPYTARVQVTWKPSE